MDGGGGRRGRRPRSVGHSEPPAPPPGSASPQEASRRSRSRRSTALSRADLRQRERALRLAALHEQPLVGALARGAERVRRLPGLARVPAACSLGRWGAASGQELVGRQETRSVSGPQRRRQGWQAGGLGQVAVDRACSSSLVHSREARLHRHHLAEEVAAAALAVVAHVPLLAGVWHAHLRGTGRGGTVEQGAGSRRRVSGVSGMRPWSEQRGARQRGAAERGRQRESAAEAQLTRQPGSESSKKGSLSHSSKRDRRTARKNGWMGGWMEMASRSVGWGPRPPAAADARMRRF